MIVLVLTVLVGLIAVVAVGATVAYIWPALLVALAFLVVALRRRARPRRAKPARMTIAASVAWLAFATWEALVHYGVVCGEECNIRVDLLLILPLLVVLSCSATVKELKSS